MIYLITLILFLTTILPLLIAVAYFTLVERQILSHIQRRQGPNIVGIYGLLQPLADGIKLLLKESVLPRSSNLLIFIFAPIFTFTLALAGWAVIPFGEGLVISDINIGILYIFAVSSLAVHSVIMAGWASNSKYAFLGAIRAAAQMISYEVSIGLIIIAVILCVGSLSLSEIVMVQEKIPFIFPLFPAAIMFFVSVLAETNRVPFDLTEGESELVSGFNVEYSSMSFALFFLAEYCHIILMSTFGVLVFLGGWLLPFNIL